MASWDSADNFKRTKPNEFQTRKYKEDEDTNSLSYGHLSTNGTRSMMPFTSSPISSGHFSRTTLSLDDSMDMSDICDRFQKTLLVCDDFKTNVTNWKKMEMSNTIKQLSKIEVALTQAKDWSGVGEGPLDTPLVNSLASTLALLEPADLSLAAVTSVLSLRFHRILQKRKLLASLKSQCAELKEERRKVGEITMDIRLDIEQTKKKIQQYDEQLQSTDIEEMKMLTETFQVEIDAEHEQFSRLQTMESICSAEKIDAAILELKSLQKSAETLKAELEFAEVLPPDLREVRKLVEERKRYLQQVINKVEDLVEYGYKH